MDKTKEEILQAETSGEILRWIKAHPEQTDEEVAVRFSRLAREEYLKNHPYPDVLVKLNRKEK